MLQDFCSLHYQFQSLPSSQSSQNNSMLALVLTKAAQQYVNISTVLGKVEQQYVNFSTDKSSTTVC
jgi:hypothetical protein